MKNQLYKFTVKYFISFSLFYTCTRSNTTDGKNSNMKHLTIALLLVSYCVLVSSDDNSEKEGDSDEDTQKRPYKYNYRVKDEEKKLFFDKSESGDEEGKVTGKFSVLLADGRFLTVEYVADKDDGFVPKLSFKKNFDPFSTEPESTSEKSS